MTRARELADLGKTGGISVGTSAPGSTGGYMVGVGLSAGAAPTRQLDVASGDLVVGSAITLGGSSGIISATKFSGGWDGTLSIDDSTTSTSKTTGALVITGGVGIAKSLFVGEGISVAGTITYDDVTNIDSVGFVTAGKGLRATTGGLIVSAGVATFGSALDINSSTDISGGVNVSGGNVKVNAGIITVGTGVTISSDFIHLADNKKIQLGIASDLALYHNGSNSFVVDRGTGPLYVRGNDAVRIEKYVDDNNGEPMIIGNVDGSVDLYYDNSKKIETISTGASVYGGLRLQSGLMRERVKITAGKLSGNSVINVDNGMMHYFTTQETTTTKPNIISSAGINTDMAIGDTMCLTIITTAASGGYSFDWRVDGVEASVGVTSSWVGGSAPSSGGSSGLDTYNLTFIKTASARYTMIGNLINSA